MADYVVAGLALAPRDATFTEQRDAILAAAAATVETSTQPRAGLRAARRRELRGRRRRRVDSLHGVVESFEAQAALVDRRGARSTTARCPATATASSTPGARARSASTVTNAGPVALTAATSEAATITAGVTFPGGATVAMARVAPLASVVVTVDVASCAAELPCIIGSGRRSRFLGRPARRPAARGRRRPVGLDANRVRDSRTRRRSDTVESAPPAFCPRPAQAPPPCGCGPRSAPAIHAWQGADVGFDHLTDTQLCRRASRSAAAPFMVDVPATATSSRPSMGHHWDGGVIEVSTDGGATWADASTLATVGYSGTIASSSGNPLGGRAAFVNASAGFPAPDTDAQLRHPLANRTVQLRFRIGTDQAAARSGWTIDDIAASRAPRT